jgi:hypothetical protein
MIKEVIYMKLKTNIVMISCLLSSLSAMNPDGSKPFTSRVWTPKENYYYLMVVSNVLGMEDLLMKEITLQEISRISGYTPSLAPKKSAEMIRDDDDHIDGFGFIGGFHPEDEQPEDEQSEDEQSEGDRPDDEKYGSIYLH